MKEVSAAFSDTEFALDLQLQSRQKGSDLKLENRPSRGEKSHRFHDFKLTGSQRLQLRFNSDADL